MSCATCGRKAAAGSCVEGYVPYLSGDYPCPFNPDPLATVQNVRVLPPLPVHIAKPQDRGLTMPDFTPDGATLVLLPNQARDAESIGAIEGRDFIVSEPIPTSDGLEDLL